MTLIGHLLESYVDAFTQGWRLGENVAFRLFGRYFRRITIGPVGLELRGPTQSAYDEVLKKLEVAHAHFADATTALDTLKLQYTDELKKVDTLHAQVAAKKQEYASALSDLELTRQMLTVDRKKLRSSLGFDDRGAKISAFASGVFASLIAALIWKFGPLAWEWVARLSASAR